jgi:hypothetical protein
MAAGRDNSQPPGCGTPGRSPTHENYSGDVLHTTLGGPFTKKAPVLTPPGTQKMGNAFFMWKLEKH